MLTFARYRLLLVVVLVALVSALIALATVACGQPQTVQRPADGGGSAPAGIQGRLRLEVVDTSVTCDARTHAVRVWLDDLPSAPVPRPTEVPMYGGAITPEPATAIPPTTTGVTAFEFTLQYDPAVVWVREKSDVQLNPELDHAPPKSDVPRHFTGVSFIDNHDGYTRAGGIALGLAADIAAPTLADAATPLPKPAGVDPVAAGAPVLLMTIGLFPVGAGTAELTLDSVDLLVDVRFAYPPVETVPASITVTGDCPKLDTPTPYPSQTPSAPAATPPSPPSVTGLPPATPAPVTPIAVGSPGARADCPQAWVTYASAVSRLSLCSSPELTATADVDENGAPGLLVSADDLSGVPKPGVPRVLVAARLSSLPSFNPNLPLASVCAIGEPGGVTAQLTIGGLDALGCHLTLERNAPDGPLGSLELVAQVSPSLFLNVTVNWRTQSAGARDLAVQIAATLRASP